jgi:hypothetical protein
LRIVWRYKKLVNILKFLTNTKPIVVNHSLKLYDDAPNLTIVWDDQDFCKILRCRVLVREDIVNIIKFLRNTKPIVVNHSLKLYDDAPNLTIVWDDQDFCKILRCCVSVREDIVNIIKFLRNTKPIVVNPSLKLYDDAPNLTIVWRWSGLPYEFVARNNIRSCVCLCVCVLGWMWGGMQKSRLS